MSVLAQTTAVSPTKYIINHDIMHCTADGVVGNHLYSGRALGFSMPDDIIQLHPELKPFWGDICAHYQSIGLEHSKQVLWDLDLKQFGAHKDYQPSVFFFGPDEYEHWQDKAWFNSVHYINSKNNFMNLAMELGVEVPQTLCFDSVMGIDKVLVSELKYPCYLKAAISVAGVGIFRCEDQAALKKAMDSFAVDVPVQIQAEVKSNTFLNLQYRVLEGELMRLTASEQILDGFAHQGNRVPASYAPWESVEPMAIWLKDHGINDIFAFDVAVVENGQGIQFPAIECNPRFNGASYPTLIAQKLGIKRWSAINFSTHHRRLSDIDLKGIEYQPETKEGVIIVNWGTILAGKLIILLAGSETVQKSLFVELNTRL